MARMGEKGRCFNCKADLRPVFPRHVDPGAVDSPGFTQYDNVLPIVFDGGYGMFHDDFENGCRYEVVICHECAHELCRLVPWVDSLIRPLRSHSHTNQYKDAYPDHEGWDYEKREVTG